MLHISENQKPGVKIMYSRHCCYRTGTSMVRIIGLVAYMCHEMSLNPFNLESYYTIITFRVATC